MEIIAHRGYSGMFPENTVPAIDAAYAEPAVAAVEVDVHSSRDGHVVVVHDAHLDRTTDAVARGYPPQTPVADLTLAELSQLDAGGWFDPSFAGAQIPTLSEVLERVPEGGRLCIELKGDHPDHVSHVAAVLDDAPGVSVEVWSFDRQLLRAFAGRAPGVPIGLFVDQRRGDAPWPEHPLAAVGPWPDAFGAEVERAHAFGLRYVATASAPERVHAVAALGADAVIADFPHIARRSLDSPASATPLRLVDAWVDVLAGDAEVTIENRGPATVEAAAATLRHDVAEPIRLGRWEPGERRRFGFALGMRARRWPMLRPLSLVAESGTVLLVADY